MPSFERLHKELGSKDVVILAVDVGEPQDLVAEYINKEKFTFPVLLANETDVASRYVVNAYPTLAAIDPQGKVADYLIGSRSESALRDAIAKARAGAPLPGRRPPRGSWRIMSAVPANTVAPVTAEDSIATGCVAVMPTISAARCRLSSEPSSYARIGYLPQCNRGVCFMP